MSNFIVQGGSRLPTSDGNELIFIDNGDGTFTMSVAPAAPTYPSDPSLIVPGAGIVVSAAVGGITGSGAVNRVPKFTAAAVLGNSSVSDDGTSVSLTGTNLRLATLGKGLRIAEGVNACMGTGVLNGVTEVTIATTAVTAISRIFLSIQVPGGTPLGVIYVSSRIAGTSFGVKGAATDTSTFAWMIVEPS